MTARINLNTCAQMVEHAANSCAEATAAAAATPPPTPHPEQANLDALAVAVTSQSSSVAAQANAISLAALILAVLAVLGGVTWGWFVRRWALDVAKRSAEKWMDANAASEIAKIVKPIAPTDGGGQTPEEQAGALSEDPA